MRAWTVTWDDLPACTIGKLRSGVPSGVVDLICWISSQRPSGLEADEASMTILDILRMFRGRRASARMRAVADWPAYLAKLSRNASHRWWRLDHKSGEALYADPASLVVDPSNFQHRLEARDFLRALPRLCARLKRAEREHFMDIVAQAVTSPGDQRTDQGRRGGNRAAAARYRVRIKVQQLLYGGTSMRRTPPRRDPRLS
jgi:hypothetical protein